MNDQTSSARETITLKTPLAKEVVIKSYLTGREKRNIRKVYTQNLKQVTDESGNTRYETNNTDDLVSMAEDALLQNAVVSYDGKTENIVESLLDAPAEEYNFVLEACNNLGKDPK